MSCPVFPFMILASETGWCMMDDSFHFECFPSQFWLLIHSTANSLRGKKWFLSKGTIRHNTVLRVLLSGQPSVHQASPMGFPSVCYPQFHSRMSSPCLDSVEEQPRPAAGAVCSYPCDHIQSRILELRPWELRPPKWSPPCTHFPELL